MLVSISEESIYSVLMKPSMLISSIAINSDRAKEENN